MTPTQFQRMDERVQYYRSVKGMKETLEGQLENIREHGPRGFTIQFVGISCSVSLYKCTSDAMLPEIEKVYRSAIADCVKVMEGIDTEIGK